MPSKASWHRVELMHYEAFGSFQMDINAGKFGTRGLSSSAHARTLAVGVTLSLCGLCRTGHDVIFVYSEDGAILRSTCPLLAGISGALLSFSHFQVIYVHPELGR